MLDTIKRYRLLLNLRLSGMPLYHKIRTLKALSSMALGAKIPKYIMIGLTYRCQADCVHCCTGCYPKEKDRELTTQEVKKIIDQCRELGTVAINFFGGEPLLRSDILELIKYSSERGMYTSIDTNGYNLTEELAIQLKDNGLKLVRISIDSANPDEHDRLRNLSNSFESAVEAIKNSVGTGLKCIVSTYATKQNVDEGLKEVILLGKKLNASGVRVLLPTPSGRWFNRSDVSLSQEEEEKVRRLIDGSFVFLEGAVNVFKECGCVHKGYFYISPYGEVQPCCFVPLSFGNVREEPLGDILERIYSHEMFGDKALFSDCMMRNEEFRKKYLNVSPDTKLPLKV